MRPCCSIRPAAPPAALGSLSDGLKQTLNDADEFAPPPLPAGWEAHEDEESRSLYFYNARTGETRWDPPPPQEALVHL